MIRTGQEIPSERETNPGKDREQDHALCCN